MISPKALPMKEAIAYWKDKVRLSPGEFAKLPDEAKTLAFGVSGIARGSELESVYNALFRAVGQGTTFRDFQAECREIIERRGWTGERAWRVDNIFRTNVQGAFMTGRYAQIKRVSQARPYWQYSAVNDRRTRPAHAALHGKIFPHDHPFWEKWYPPNGYRCRCTVKTLSEDELAEKGLSVEQRDPTGSYIVPKDPKTGNLMPPVAVMPDPGWAYNPGKTFWGGVVEQSGKPGKWTAIKGLKGPERYHRPALRNVRPADIFDLDEGALLPSGRSDDFYRAEFVKRFGEEKVLTDAAGEPVVLSLRSFLIDKTPGAKPEWKFKKAGHGQSIPLIEDMLLHPYEIWLTPQQNEQGRVRLSRRYVCVWKTRDKERIAGMQVVEVNGGVFQGVTSFIPMKQGDYDLEYAERQRLGLLLFKGGMGR